MARRPLQDITHGRSNHGDDKDASDPHSSTFEEVEQLVTSQLKPDLGRSAHSNCTVRENERREQGGRDEWRKIERIAWNFFF